MGRGVPPASELLEVALQLAREAGTLLQAGRPAGPLRVTSKSTPTDVVTEMDHAAEAMGRIAQVPVLYLYGAHDQIIPRRAALDAARKLRPGDQTAYYAHGWHLLLRDHQGPLVWRDVLAFIREPGAPLPSAAPPIPGAPALTHASRATAGG